MEIGALDKPIVPPDTPGVFYVDHADTDSLRAKYGDDPHVDKDRLVRVGGVWGTQTLLQACGHAAPFDLIVASHVVEHVPDLITWLEELRSVLTPDGRVRLAVPDRRYTFDHLRRETEVADVLDAWIQRARRPLTRCVLDHALHVAPVDAWQAWQPDFDATTLVTMSTPEQAIAQARQAWVDGQCWRRRADTLPGDTREISRVALATCTLWARQPVSTGESSSTSARTRSGRRAAAIRLR